MNPTKNSESLTATADKKKQLVVYIEITDEQPIHDDKRFKAFLAERNLKPIAFLGIQQTGSYEERKKEIRALEQTLKSAILTAKQYVLKLDDKEEPVGLLFNTFDVFELDASLPVLEVLLNSIGDRRLHPVYFADFPEVDIEYLEFLAQVYQRRSERRKVQEEAGEEKAKPTPKVPPPESDHHFTEERNRLISRLGKYQRRLLDENNLAAMRMVNRLQRQKSSRRQKMTLINMAIHLEKAGIATSTGKIHTPKSVSRLIDNIDQIKEKFTGFPPLEEYIVQRAGSQSAVLLPPVNEVLQRGKPIDKRKLKIDRSNRKEYVKPKLFSPSPTLETILRENPQLINPVQANTDALYPDFGDQDKIAFRLIKNLPSGITKDLSLKIYNNLPADDKDAYYFQAPWPAGSELFEIDIREDTYLLPGRHYVEIEYQGKPIGLPFIITLYRNKLDLNIIGGQVI